MKRTTFLVLAIACLGSNATRGLAVTLTGLYTFETSLTNDDSGNANHLTAGAGSSAPAPISPGGLALGTASARFTNTNDLTQAFTVPSTVYTANTDFSFATMVRKVGSDPVIGYETILSTNNFRFQFTQFGDNDLRLDSNSPANSFNDGPNGTFLPDKWYIAMMTYNHATGNVDAFLQDPADPFPRGPSFSVGGRTFGGMNQFRLGADGLSGIGGTDTFGGQLDNVTFASGVLTQAERLQYLQQNGGAPAVTGLVARYDHENAGNRLQDTSGNVGLDATNGGGTTFVAPPPSTNFIVGTTAAEYNGGGNHFLNVPAPAHTAGQSFTLTGLVRDTLGDGSYDTIFSSNTFRFQYQPISGGVLAIDMPGFSSLSSSSGSFALNTWYFVALVYDAATNTVSGYLNDGSSPLLGSPVFSAVLAGNGLDATQPLRIGGDGLSGIGGIDTFSGQIDGVRLYGSALSSEGLQGVYSSMLVPEPSSLIMLLFGAIGWTAFTRKVR